MWSAWGACRKFGNTYMKFRKETGVRDLHLRVISTLSSAEPGWGHEMLGGFVQDSVAHHYWNGRQGRLEFIVWGQNYVESEDTDRQESMVQWEGCRWWHLGLNPASALASSVS